MLRALILLGFLLTHPTQAAGLTAQTDPDALPDRRVATGGRDIAQAWLVAPTGRYRHFVQGSRYEAGGLRVRLADNTVLTLTLDDNLVFEDRRPRLADLDGDGADEVVLVLSSVTKGASLAAYSVVGDVLKLKAKTPFIGRPHRWLNPAGIADFDGDGRVEVALVAMPHLIKRLEIWALVDGIFVSEGSWEGFSNHRLGSVHTEMAAVADFNGDEVADLALPSADRRAVRIMSFAGGSARQLAAYDLGGAADGAFALEAVEGGHVLRVGLEGGGSADIAIHPTDSVPGS